MRKNPFIRSPITVIYKKKYVFINDQPHIKKALLGKNIKTLREFYGKDWQKKLSYPTKKGGESQISDEITLDDIEEILASNIEQPTLETEIQKPKTSSSTEYVHDVLILPEDTLWEFRNKIAHVTGIPTYRQHI